MKSQSLTPGSRGSTGGDWALPLPSLPPPPSAPSPFPTTPAWVSQMDVTVIYQARDGKHADGDQHMARSASPSLATNLFWGVGILFHLATAVLDAVQDAY